MATGIFTLRNQLQGRIQKAWTQSPTYSGVFNGTNQYLSTPTSTNLNLGTSSFTLEYWVNLNAFTSANIPVSGGGSSSTYDPLFGYGYAPSALYLSSNGSSFDIASAQTIGTMVANRWYHIAIVRNGSTFYTFLNGVQGATFTSSASIYQSTNAFLIGQGQGTQFLNGQISNLRFVKGTALYTANFTPPASPLTAVSGTQLLTLQNPTIIDNSTNAFTITNNGSTSTQQAFPFTSSAYAPPAVDYLVVAGGGGGSAGGGGAGGLLQGISNVTTGTSLTVTVGAGGSAGTSASAIGTNGQNSVFGSITATGGGTGGIYYGGYTAPNSGGSGGGSYYSNGVLGAQGVFGQGNRGGGQFNSGGSGYAGGGGGGAGTVGLNSSGASTNNGAGNGGAGIASVISGTVTTYAGGGGSGADAGSNPTGGVGGGGTGYISNVGGSSGTPNTGGGGGGNGNGTAGTGGSGIVIISYPDTYNAPTALTGTYTASTSGSGSVYFNGATSTRLTFPSNTAFAFGLGAYTIEAWVNLSSYAATQGSIFDSGNATGALDFFVISTGALGIGEYGVGNILASSASAVSLNSWNHVAVVRASTATNDTKLYVNGFLVATGTDTKNWTVTTTPSVGGINIAGYSTNGYISNLRVVKGTAIYTSAFTPSVIPLTAISGTSLLLNSVSGAYLADSSTNAFTCTTTGSPTWNQSSPFATGLGYKNRVYTWTASGSVTF